MFCKYCGSVISENEKTCHHCGRRLHELDYSATNNNSLAIRGFALSVFIATTSLFLNIIILMEIIELWAIILLCVIQIGIAVASLVCCFKGHNKTMLSDIEKIANSGIALSVLAIVITVIFMIIDIVDLYTVGFVPVHSSLNTIII